MDTTSISTLLQIGGILIAAGALLKTVRDNGKHLDKLAAKIEQNADLARTDRHESERRILESVDRLEGRINGHLMNTRIHSGEDLRGRMNRTEEEVDRLRRVRESPNPKTS